MPKKNNTWRNRIVGEGEENPATLKANPRNWRIHSIAQQNRRSIRAWVNHLRTIRNVSPSRDGF